MSGFWTDVSVGTPGVMDADTRRLLDRVAQLALPSIETQTPDQARAEFRRAVARSNPQPAAPVEAVDADAAGVPVRLYRPAAGDLPVLVYLHGGGFVLGDLETHDPLCRILAAQAGSVVVAVDYRRGPDHPFPAAVEDAWTALRWAARSFGGPALAVGGDSAGGTLSAVAALKARDAGLALALQLLIYPAVDLGENFPSRKLFAEGLMLTGAAVRWFNTHYFGTPMPTPVPDSAPLHAASHAGLAPAAILTAGFDLLRDEGHAYAESLRTAGVPVRRVCFEGTIHGCLGLGRYLAAGRAMLDEAAEVWRRIGRGQMRMTSGSSPSA